MPAHDIHFDVTVHVLSDAGCVRDTNEDCVRFVEPHDPAVLGAKGLLLLVADGMGGHSAGEVASRLAVDAVHRAYYAAPGDPAASLEEAFHEANREIHEAARRDHRLAGMGTTCTALVVRHDQATCAHVGDTRLYLVRDDRMYLMTEDHSAVRAMVSSGLLTPGEARRHADRNVILRALGTHPDVEVTTWSDPFPCRANDSFLLCSDGLHDPLTDDEIRQIVVAHPDRSGCEALVQLARSRGGPDNITVALATLAAPGGSREVGRTRGFTVLK